MMVILGPAQALAGDTSRLLATIKAVGKEGRGNAEAGRAWAELVRGEPESLIDILCALDGASPVAANWLRSAVDAIAERALKAGRKLPVTQLEAFVRDTHHAGTSRRLAYEWLSQADPTAPNRLLPGMLQDPGAELRRDAVTRAVKEVRALLDKGDKKAAAAAYRKLLDAARDRDQVELITKELKQLGETVDVAARLGFIRKWLLLGPFDNTSGAGFQAVFPPEQGITLSTSHAGKKGAPLRWKEYATNDASGLVDLNKAIGKHMGAVAYGLATVDSPEEKRVELRAGSNNAVKIFLNGKQVYFREEYHHGMRPDQHVGAGTLQPGRNEILVKVCQNEQTEDWAQTWSFQLRICDALGGPVPLKHTTNTQDERKGS
jgi:hypothetical protein